MQSRSRILVVDDNEINVSIIEEILGDEHVIATALSGERALDLAQSFGPDLILLDIMMPGIDGYETCRRLRQDPVLRYAKIILVSAKAMVSERLDGYDAGADDYITKPFVPEELLAKVNVFLRLKFVEELHELKSSILQLLNHEVRTPMTSVISSLEMLASDSISMDESRELARTARSGCKRLLSLFEKSDLLCQLRAGHVEPQKVAVNADTVFADVVTSLQPFAESRSVTILTRTGKDEVLYGDHEQISIVVYSLIHNAIRFSSLSAEIRLDLSEDDKWSTVTVADSGAGIDPQYVKYVFDELLCASIMHHSEGHGLSLALSKEIVRLHGGELLVESQPNKGALFKLRLPRMPASVEKTKDDAAPLGVGS